MGCGNSKVENTTNKKQKKLVIVDLKRKKSRTKNTSNLNLKFRSKNSILEVKDKLNLNTVKLIKKKKTKLENKDETPRDPQCTDLINHKFIQTMNAKKTNNIFNVFDFSSLKKRVSNGKEFNLKSLLSRRKKEMAVLDNKVMDCLNYSARRVNRYFNDQQPPPDLSSYPKGKKWVDDMFPPTANTVLGKNKRGKRTDPNNLRYNQVLSSFQVKPADIIWLRPEEIFPGGVYTLFEESIDIDDVNQGNLGNCYFMSSLAAMCEFPQTISELFRYFNVHPQGIYEIVFNINGQWQIVIIDDYFPCYKNSKWPIFSKPHNNELWVMLLEKAWAKINGGYINIVGGWPNEVLETLTCFCIKSIDNQDPSEKDNLWEKILSADQNNHLITCSTINDKFIEEMGLISGHAFTLISAEQAELKGNKVRLLRIRNPWGFREWNGKWSDNSKEWDDEAKKAFRSYENKNDGTFFISIEDYKTYFAETQICKIKSPACTKCIVIEKSKFESPNMFELQLNRETAIDISAIKQSYRFNRNIPDGAEMTINILLLKKDEGSFVYIASDSSSDNNPVIDVTLQPATYLIYLFANYKSSTFDKPREYSLYIVSNNYFSLTDLGVDENYEILYEIVSNTLRLEPRLEEENVEVKIQDELYVLTINKFYKTSIGLFYIKNMSDKAVHLKIKNENLNFIIFTKIPIENEFTVSIQANEEIIIIGERFQYFGEYWFRFSYSLIAYSDYLKSMSKFILPTKNKQRIEEISSVIIRPQLTDDEYDYFFKRHDIEINSITETFDYIKITKEYFTIKYPEYMLLLEKFPSMVESDSVKFMDIYDNGDFTYFGEWKKDDDFIKHGRGITKYKDGSLHLGYLTDDLFNGFGIMAYKNGTVIEINFRNGNMDGEGHYYKEDQIKKCFYKEGIFEKFESSTMILETKADQSTRKLVNTLIN